MKYKTILIFIILIPLVITGCNGEKEDISNKIEDQETILEKELLDKRPREDNTLLKILEDAGKNKGDNPINLKTIASNTQRYSVLLSLKLRKIVVPITMLCITFDIFLLSILGNKNLKNRKKHIYSIVFMFIFFLFAMNLPLYLLWRFSLTEKVMSFEVIYNFVFNVTNFFKNNSFTFSVILCSYGLIFKATSKNNLPNKLASTYLIRMSYVSFIAFQTLPFLIKLSF